MGTFADGYSLRTGLANFNGCADAVDGALTVHWGGTTGGTSTAYTVTPNPAWTSTTRDAIRFIMVIPHTTNTGASTLNVSGLGTGSITINGSSLAAGQFAANIPYLLAWNGSAYSLLGATTSASFQILGRANATAVTTEGHVRFQIDGITHALIGASASERLSLYTGVGTMTERLRLENGAHRVFNMGTGAGTNAMRYDTGNGAWTYDVSSARYKKDIEDSPYGLNAIKALQPRKYKYKEDDRVDIGFIAEELHTVIPELAPLDAENIPQSVMYDRLTSVLCKAIQELSAKVEALEAQLAGTPQE